MRIPIFEEIFFGDFTYESIDSTIKASKIGKTPCFCNLSMVATEELVPVLVNIRKSLKAQNKNAKFPFPFYIITNQIKSFSGLSLKSSYKDLPNHFLPKVRKLNAKELQLLKKVEILSDKTSNLNITKQLEAFSKKSSILKELYLQAKELDFYQSVFEHLQDTNEK